MMLLFYRRIVSIHDVRIYNDKYYTHWRQCTALDPIKQKIGVERPPPNGSSTNRMDSVIMHGIYLSLYVHVLLVLL